MAYNIMIFKAQRMSCDADGGYSAPLSEIIKGFGSTTRDSPRIRVYIEQMCSTVVKWFPLSSSDEIQATIAGLEAPPADPTVDGRIFTLLSEARFSRMSGEQWVTWFFPPTIRDMVIEPSRWAQLDIKELASLSHYAGLALYEICARYKDVPGGLTNRAEPSWWVRALRSDPDTKPREWRKFKSETLKPAVAEISQRTSLEVRLVEYKKGRAVVGVQFAVKRKPAVREMSGVDLGLVDQAAEFGIRERDLDLLVDAFDEERVRKAMTAMQSRLRAQPTVAISSPLAYLRKSLRNGLAEPLFEEQTRKLTEPPVAFSAHPEEDSVAVWRADRRRAISDELDDLAPEELEHYAEMARTAIAGSSVGTPSTMKRFANRQYRSPIIWEYIRSAYASAKYGPEWNVPPRELSRVS